MTREQSRLFSFASPEVSEGDVVECRAGEPGEQFLVVETGAVSESTGRDDLLRLRRRGDSHTFLWGPKTVTAVVGTTEQGGGTA